MELVIDTSTETSCVALASSGSLVASFCWLTLRNHTMELLPRLVALLSETNATLESARGIVVAQGPGSFNGLRVGIATAQGLSFAIGIPLVGISTLEAAAFTYAETGLPIYPVLSAGRGELATALFQLRDNKWLQLEPEHLVTVPDLVSGTVGPAIVCGEIDSVTADRFREEPGKQLMLLTGEAASSRVNSLSRLGSQRLRAASGDDSGVLQPLYLRKPAITIPNRRRDYNEMPAVRQ